MNVLQSFMGCMYPGSIKTESIESLDHDPSCTFQVSNIDEKATEVSRGEIHVTDKDMYYYRPGRFPIQWPLGCIRRYGCNEGGEIFSFETGRQSSTGQAIYAFHLANGQDLVNRLKERIERNAKVLNDDCRSPNSQSQSSFRFNKNCFSSGTDQSTVEYNHLKNQNERVRLSNINVPTRKACHDSQKSPSETQPNTSAYIDIQGVPLRSPSYLKRINEEIGLKPLPYSNINADVTESLNELAKAHAANRKR